MQIVAPELLTHTRFTLRPLKDGDAELVAQAITASYDHLKEFMPWAQPSNDPWNQRKRIRQNYASYLRCEDFALGIFSPDGSVFLGGTGFHLRNRSLRSFHGEIGMWISADQAGQGLGTEVLQAMIEWGFREWPWRRLEWRCDPENHGSARVAEKCGMKEEGRLHGTSKDHRGRWRGEVIYALTKYPEIEDPKSITVRPLSQVHARQTAHVHIDSWRDAYWSIMPIEVFEQQSYSDKESFWFKLLAAASDRSRYLGLFSGEHLMGFASIGPSRFEKPGWDGELLALYLPQNYQGNGFGRVLWNAAAAQLKALGFKAVMCWVLERNLAAIGFYKAMGFKLLNYQKEDDGLTEIAMGLQF
ncbi:GNAT family N-acetyltransferase [Pseudobacteriovorax antillogorgiicola]|uniref:Protein N-acetyltransferase, RimJ/RimL family n=1 Tax=Pseudobacteriovorax antillogorgiicola TaxID=1513793 RepID=A0A1Y6CUA0_9BACT|nr:GNAT family N-acetyltransferase [Pseudobacteriovorax antillogorgiicola]TCS44778.1 RimJ/RimL family protein N-acetyltransferase [Pseudobacteriovorax antillogorgiicola]SMF77526.1 Protein N-acetyltransferase, RimJ/RimL family [Pseudobacteriovorax antillogorgiicola]